MSLLSYYCLTQRQRDAQAEMEIKNRQATLNRASSHSAAAAAAQQGRITPILRNYTNKLPPGSQAAVHIL